ACRAIEQLMEKKILLGEQLALRGGTLHLLREGVELGDIFLGRAASEASDDRAFEHLENRHQLVQLTRNRLVILALLDGDLEFERAGKGHEGEAADKGADDMAGLDHPDRLQGAHGLPHRRSADAQLAGHLAFGPKGVAPLKRVTNAELLDAILRGLIQERAKGYSRPRHRPWLRFNGRTD